jgi:hypothetical protein
LNAANRRNNAVNRKKKRYLSRGERVNLPGLKLFLPGFYYLSKCKSLLIEVVKVKVSDTTMSGKGLPMVKKNQLA